MAYSLGMPDLSDSDARLLAFEERAPRSAGAKEEAIRAQLGISPVRYYQRLNLLIDVPAAMFAHPSLTARLRRIRDRRAVERSARAGD
ncbi:DUF3263 domain-containing protein [Corynebacterium suedekumii]|uniref:DUF3263 domain-containing protein n=1 Tax=Corynebacterium suedekumii TaxID=3049801 RepID=A0ABY8VNZ8_9CORY|nr:DUF3263 domain-containing protein [Corynebacterium suedekumii]WIM70712.1 DUF3263 domain-containing protein [Corynebacterium suedekumii]